MFHLDKLFRMTCYVWHLQKLQAWQLKRIVFKSADQIVRQ